MSDLEDLKAVRELLSDPNRWTQGNYATKVPVRLAADQTTTADLFIPLDHADENTCFCLQGAYAFVTKQFLHHPMNLMLVECVPPEYSIGEKAHVVAFNDTPGRTHEEILAALDCAIAKAEQFAD